MQIIAWAGSQGCGDYVRKPEKQDRTVTEKAAISLLQKPRTHTFGHTALQAGFLLREVLLPFHTPKQRRQTEKAREKPSFKLIRNIYFVSSARKIIEGKAATTEPVPMNIFLLAVGLFRSGDRAHRRKPDSLVSSLPAG